MSRAPVDLDRLNDAERGVLRLLAEGHTAKSIANATGSTPAAVNERLREARRKTGVGSSRELARLLRAQENRHEQIGVGTLQRTSVALPKEDAQPWRPQMGVFAMIAFLVIAAGSAAALMSQAPVTGNEVDPLLGTPLETAPDPAALHARVRSEPRDGEWAPRMESAIRARLMQIPLIGKDGNALRVTCAATLCEMAGTIIWTAPPPKAYDPKLPESRAESSLQEKALFDDLAKLGLKNETGLFTGGQGKPDRIVFLLYYSRADAKPKEHGAG
jgi:DNA-binding CsgD family transcriptional regulator